MLAEFRCMGDNRDPGMKTMFAPSIHPDTGERVEWESDVQLPARASATELLERMREAVPMTLLARRWVREGCRHHACNALAGALAHANWEEEKASQFLSLVIEHARGSDFEHLRQAPRNVRDTFAKFRRRQPVTGLARLIELGTPEPVVRKIRDLLHLGQTTALTLASEGWQKPLPIENPLPSVNPFDVRVLPDAFRAFVEDAAELMQAPMDFIAAPLELAYAGAAGRRIKIYPKREDDTWRVVPNLWGVSIAPPVLFKTATQEIALRPVRQIEARYIEEYGTTFAQYLLDEAEDEQRLKAWNQLCVAAYKKGNRPPPRPVN
jgi:hypothetical protein